MDDNWRDIRDAIIERDKVCYRCLGVEKLTAHHIIPRSEEGGNNPENLITLCVKCHDIVEIAGCRSLVEILATIDEPDKLWRVVNRSTPQNYKGKINIHFNGDPILDKQPLKMKKPKPLATYKPKYKKKVFTEPTPKREPVTINKIRLSIIKMRNDGLTYDSISDKLGIDRAMVYYIETHKNYKPGRSMKAKLNINPDGGLVYTRKRRQSLDEIALSWGYPGWSAYETYILNEPWVSEAVANLERLREIQISR